MALKLPVGPMIALGQLIQMAEQKLSGVPVLKAVHSATQPSLEALGFEWERRREGENGIGMWRRSLHGSGVSKKTGRAAKSPLPRRFVFIPGFGDTPLSWAGALALMAPVFWSRYDEIVILDYPGWAGFLAREKAFSSLDDMFRASEDLLDSLKPTAILGHSLGGWIAAHYAASCGEGRRPLARAAAKAPGYAGPDDILLCAPGGLYGEPSELDTWRGHFERGIQEGFDSYRGHIFHKEPAWFRFMVGHFRDFMGREDVVEFLRSFDPRHLLTDRARNIRARTWIVWGEEDTLSPPSWAQVWVNGVGERAKAVVMPGLGHSLQAEAPARVAALLAQILLGRELTEWGSRWWKVLEKQPDYSGT